MEIWEEVEGVVEVVTAEEIVAGETKVVEEETVEVDLGKGNGGVAAREMMVEVMEEAVDAVVHSVVYQEGTKEEEATVMVAAKEVVHLVAEETVEVRG